MPQSGRGEGLVRNRNRFPGLQPPTYQCEIFKLPWPTTPSHILRLAGSSFQPLEGQEVVGLDFQDTRKGGVRHVNVRYILQGSGTCITPLHIGDVGGDPCVCRTLGGGLHHKVDRHLEGNQP